MNHHARILLLAISSACYIIVGLDRLAFFLIAVESATSVSFLVCSCLNFRFYYLLEAFYGFIAQLHIINIMCSTRSVFRFENGYTHARSDSAKLQMRSKYGFLRVCIYFQYF